MSDFDSKLTKLIENYEGKVDAKRNQQKDNRLRWKKHRELEVEKFATIKPQIERIIEQLKAKHINSIKKLEIFEDRKLLLHDENIGGIGQPIIDNHYDFGCDGEEARSNINEIKFVFWCFTKETMESFVPGGEDREENSSEKLVFETGEELLEHLLKIIEVILVREANNF